MARTYDLVVRGGLVATAGGSAVCDLGVAGGRIAQIGGPMNGREVLDARDCVVLPGAVDVHVHLTLPEEPAGPAWCDDFESGSAAALAGGVTTIGNMCFPGADGEMRSAVRRDGERARALAMADVLLHPVLAAPGPHALADLEAVRAQGCGTVKMFMVDPAFDRAGAGVVEVVRRAGELGMLTMLHGEDASLVQAATNALLAKGQGGLRHYGESRPVAAEVVAVERAGALALAAEAPLYMVHVSSAEALAAAARWRALGARVHIETRPLYLHLTEERMLEADAAKYVGQPPLRLAADQEALWRGLADGAVATVASDHAPWRLEDKLDPALTIAHLRPGVANLEWELPMLYSAGVRTGRLSLERLVEVTSTHPARLFGLYPRKGAIAVGSDADLVVLDPAARRTIGPPYFTRAGYSVFDGMEVVGWPRYTLRRGETAFAAGEVLARPGSGEVLSSTGYRPL